MTSKMPSQKVDDVDYYPGLTLKDLAEQFIDDGLYGEIPDRDPSLP